MPAYRITYKMKQGARGWSYIYHLLASSAAEAAGVARANDKVSPLLQLHVPLTVLRSVSAAREGETGDPSPARQAISIPLNLPGTLGGIYKAPDVVSAAIVLRLNGAAGHSRTVSIRGVPDDFITFNGDSGEFEMIPALFNRLGPYLDSIARTPAFQIRYKVPFTEVGYNWLTVSSLRPVADSDNLWTEVRTTEAHGLAVGNTVEFGGSLSCAYEGLRGIFRVIGVPAPGSIVIVTRYRGAGAFQAVSKVRVRKVDYLYEAITARVGGTGARTSDLLEVSSRDTGRVTGLPRGRRFGRSCRT